jgi:starch phosphorylase
MNYAENLYAPAARWHDQLTANHAEAAKRFADQAARVSSLWKEVQVGPPMRKTRGAQRVGDTFQVNTEVDLGELRPEEVDIELYFGIYKSFSELANSQVIPMDVVEDLGQGRYIFGSTLTCDAAGRFGFSVRATPKGDAWLKFSPGLLTWASE